MMEDFIGEAMEPERRKECVASFPGNVERWLYAQGVHLVERIRESDSLYIEQVAGYHDALITAQGNS